MWRMWWEGFLLYTVCVHTFILLLYCIASIIYPGKWIPIHSNSINTYLYVVQVCGRGGQEVDVITHRVEPRLVVVVGPPEFQAYRNHGVRGRERHGPPFRWNQIYNIHYKSLKKNLIRKFIKELSSLNTKATLRPKHVFYKLLSVHFISSLEDIKAYIIQNLTFWKLTGLLRP